MIGVYIAIGALAFVALLFLLFSYYAYKKAFFSDRTKKRDPYKGIDKRGYKPYEARMRSLIDNIIALPCERVQIISRDGLKLSGRYYHVKDGAPLEIQCHGYRSTPLRDFAGSGEECFKRGYNMLLIDHRAHGESEGKTITFGIKERFDLLDWVKYAIERFGGDVKIILYGISMGAATVLMAAGEDMPENVKGVIADCPYSSPVDIIARVGGASGVPEPFVKLFAITGARIFGGFSLLESSPREAVKRARVPILLIHGEADTFVPAYMSDEIYAANPNIILKKFPEADHAVSYLCDTDGYLALADGFVDDVLA